MDTSDLLRLLERAVELKLSETTTSDFKTVLVLTKAGHSPKPLRSLTKNARH